MSTSTLTRAWTDLDFRSQLSADELDKLNHPAGDIDGELSELFIQEATGHTTQCTVQSAQPPLCCC